MRGRAILLMAALLVFPILSISDSMPGRVEMVFDTGNTDDYFALPYPNDLHRYPDGRVNRKNFPVPEANLMSAHYRDLSDGDEGFAVSESVFMRLTGQLERLKLPTALESVKPESPLMLVNIDPSSPGYGEKIPVISILHDHTRGPLKNLLAISPFPGFVLRENTVHAAIVLKSLHPDLVQSPTLAALLAGKGPDDKAVTVMKPLADYLAKQGIGAATVAAATVYTTGDPTWELRAIIDYIGNMPRPRLDEPLKPYRVHPAFYALKGSFLAPQFQTGSGSELAFGGKVIFDGKRPVMQKMERIPIVVMVPKGKMPEKGFPLVIYLHGGGNNTDEFLDHIIKSKDNQFTPGEGPARTFAEQDIAGVSSAIVKNPERYGRMGKSGRTAELPFYNFFRGDVLVANHWQASADNSALLRLMKSIEIDASLCPETDARASRDGKIRFDADNFFAMGFSMGGTILGVWSGVEPGIKATIPAGPSGHWGLLIRNFTAVPAKPYFFAWLTGGKPGEEMDARWPVISIIQAVLEPADTITYAPYVFRRPFPGAPPKNVYMAVGPNDYYTKSVTQNAISAALGLPLAGRMIDDTIVESQRLNGFAAPMEFPVSGNVMSEDGRKVTAALLQYEPDSWTGEGHNVNYNLTETKHQYGCFLRTLADTGVAVIPAPGPEGSPCAAAP